MMISSRGLLNRVLIILIQPTLSTSIWWQEQVLVQMMKIISEVVVAHRLATQVQIKCLQCWWKTLDTSASVRDSLSSTIMTPCLFWINLLTGESILQKRALALLAQSISNLSNLFAIGRNLKLILLYSEFCGHPVCKICIVKTRPYPGIQS